MQFNDEDSDIIESNSTSYYLGKYKTQKYLNSSNKSISMNNFLKRVLRIFKKWSIQSPFVNDPFPKETFSIK